jgi:phosphohistidine phosphatase
MGKTLYLLRHAKSSWDDPTLADHDRPLAPRGRRASHAIAGHLRAERITPALVLCSTSTRTRQTLERIGRGFDEAVHVHREIEAGLYGSSSEELLMRLHDVPGDVDSVMLIGHAPALPELASSLAGGGARLDQLREKFPTAALATLTFRGAWHELAPGGARLAGFVRPRDLTRS